MTTIAMKRMVYGCSMAASCLLTVSIWLSLITVQGDSVPASEDAVIVRHAPAIDGRIDGSVQQLIGENVSLSSNTIIIGNLLVPGIPTVVVTGSPKFGGTVEGTGSTLPAGYSVILSSKSQLGHLLTRTDPVALASVPLPPASPGTRDVVVTRAGQNVGDFVTIRDLTLNAGVGSVTVPPGTYRNFTVYKQSTFVFGQVGSLQPAIYNLAELNLNSTSQLQVLGPVVINVANKLLLASGSTMGSSNKPHWLGLNITRNDVNLDGGSSLYGFLNAPSSAVALKGKLKGLVSSDRLSISSSGVLQVVSNQAPLVSAGPDLNSTFPGPVTLNGTASDDGLPIASSLAFSWSKLSGPGTVTFATPGVAATTATFSSVGTYVLRLTASDSKLSSNDDVSISVISVIPTNQPPQVSAGQDQTITLPGTASLNGSASDDGLPTATLMSTWSRFSGPGTVTFANAIAAVTTASFGATGSYVLRLTASDSQLNAFSDVTITVNAANQPPTVSLTSPQNNAIFTAPASITLVASANDPDGQVLKVEFFQGSTKLGETSTSPYQFALNNLGEGIHSLSVRATDNQNAATTSSLVSITVNTQPGGETLPPDPVTVAPPLNRSVATDMRTSTEFLHTGENPIQTGVAPGTIELTRAAVLRGQVRTRDGAPLPGVKITVLNHAEFGSTLSRADGMFDMAVNGGGQLTVDYQKTGFIPAQRQVYTAWQNYVKAPVVVLIPYDGQGTTVNFTGNNTVQVARGGVVTDSDGPRQATLLVLGATSATLVMPNGSVQPISSLSIRATEYTVGPNGPEAMPALLPPTSGYTYAVEYSADEVVAAGAKGVQFSQPLIHYVENFLNFPVGGIVPVGYYDREKGIWIPSKNGRVIHILSIVAGQAVLDIEGSNQPASDTALAALGIMGSERQRIAALYSPGQSLWRVPINHFSTYDLNWGSGPPPDAGGPKQPPTPPNPPQDPPCQSSGSVIECQNQILGEYLPIVGTPFTLHYSSDRVPGRKNTSLQISLSGDTLPPNIKGIELEVAVAGQFFTQSFPAQPNQSHNFSWDGKDAYGRVVQGQVPAIVRIGYVYDAVYQQPAQLQQSFAALTGIPISGNRARQEITLWQQYIRNLGQWDSRALGLGGWTLSANHAYDTIDQSLYLGDSRRRSVSSANPIITAIAGRGLNSGFSGDGGPAKQARFNAILGVEVGPDGSIYIADTGNNRIRKVSTDGTVTTVAGVGPEGGSGIFGGDGGPATQANLNLPTDVALGSDGSLYIADYQNRRVRRVGPDGIITTVAGNGEFLASSSYDGDGKPATEVNFGGPRSIAIGPDGSLYISSEMISRIFRVSPDGYLSTVAGIGNFFHLGGSPGYSGDGGPATQAQISQVYGLSVGQDGSLYFADTLNYCIRRVTTDGVVDTIAGAPGLISGDGDGGPATEAGLGAPLTVAVGNDGSYYIVDFAGNALTYVIRRVAPDGIISTFAGIELGEYGGDGGPARQAGLASPNGLTVGPDGYLYIADTFSFTTRVVKPALPGLSLNELVIPSEDGAQLDVFSGLGRHLRTLDGLTQAVRFEFTYDRAGRLTAVTDSSGNATTIDHDANGKPTSIVSPYGQRTALTVDSNGYLASLSNPASETSQFSYDSEGLLVGMTDPRGNQYRYSYDALGRLQRDDDPAGGSKALSRVDLASGGREITLTDGLNHSTRYKVEFLSAGGRRLTNTFRDSTQSTTVIKTDGGYETTLPDGTTNNPLEGPDPRWGMMAPILKSKTTSTPEGLALNTASTRSADLTDPLNVFSLATQTDTTNINGRVYTSTYTATNRTFSNITPVGRQSTSALDSLGRLTQQQVAGLNSTNYAYDSRGRLASQVQGIGATARTTGFAYDSDGFLQTVSDPLGHTNGFAYDLAGRVVQQTLPDSRVIRFSYDANGNLAGITPPGRPQHQFAFTPVNLQSAYAPPSLGFPGQTTYQYNLDRQLGRILRPDGRAVDLSYDAAGRLASQTISRGQFEYAYAQTTGNLASITAPDGGILSYVYDGSLLRTSAWSGVVNGSVSKTFDNDFRMITHSVNAANTVNFQYDNDSLLIGAGNLALTRNSQNGLLAGTTLGNFTDSYTYNGFAEPISYSATLSGAQLYSAQYLRDRLGRIIQKTETVGGTSQVFDYGYDQAGRLVGVSKNGSPISLYTYDTNSNRLSHSSAGGTAVGTYDSQDRLTQYGSTTYTYNANGELLSKMAGGQLTTYQYDELGNLLGVTLPDGTQSDYLIDGEVRRIGKKVNGVLVRGFLYQDGPRPIAELDGNNNLVSLFVYGTRLNVPDYIVKGAVNYRIVSDHLGSPRLVVNAFTGQIVQQMEYDDFGVVLNDTNPGFQPFGFAGGLYDRDTKLVRFGVREYDPETGRWLSRDPILFAGGDTNLYNYVVSDPINFIDPDGKIPVLVVAPIIGGVVGGTVGAITTGLMGGSGKEIAGGFATGFIGGATAGLGLATGLGAAAATAVGLGASTLTALPDSGANPADVRNGLRRLLNPPPKNCPE